jgi:hypothetical protein
MTQLTPNAHNGWRLPEGSRQPLQTIAWMVVYLNWLMMS